MKPLSITPEHVGHRVRVVKRGTFYGSSGMIESWREGKRRDPVTVQLDNDSRYRWFFEPRDLELVEGTA